MMARSNETPVNSSSISLWKLPEILLWYGWTCFSDWTTVKLQPIFEWINKLWKMKQSTVEKKNEMKQPATTDQIVCHGQVELHEEVGCSTFRNITEYSRLSRGIELKANAMLIYYSPSMGRLHFYSKIKFFEFFIREEVDIKRHLAHLKSYGTARIMSNYEQQRLEQYFRLTTPNVS